MFLLSLVVLDVLFVIMELMISAMPCPCKARYKEEAGEESTDEESTGRRLLLRAARKLVTPSPLWPDADGGGAGRRRQKLAALLAATHALRESCDINHLHLATVMHGLTAEQLCNLYRYLYLEWKNVRRCFVEFHRSNETAAAVYIWERTPRQFAERLLAPDATADEVGAIWCQFLRRFLAGGKAYGLFFATRVQSYFVPFD